MHKIALLKYLGVLNMIFLTTTAEKSATLVITTTSCESSCRENHNEACPTSITLNNREMSEQKDGFNILVLDSYTGITKKRKHYKYFTDAVYWRKDKFVKFFQGLDNNSTVIITFQNMCVKSAPNWHTYLSGLDMGDLQPSRGRIDRQIILIACKGTCPKGVPDHYKAYSGNSEGFGRITKTLVFPGGRSPTDHKSRFNTYEPDIPAIACGVAAAIIIVTLIYACFLYYRQRSTPDENYYTSFQQRVTATPRVDDTKNPDLVLNEPIYEEISPTNICNTHNNTDNLNTSNHTTEGERGTDKEQRYHIPEIDRRITSPLTSTHISTSSTTSCDRGVSSCGAAGAPPSPGGTIASAPPLSLYVSMDRVSENCYSNVPSSTVDSHLEQPTERNSLL